MSQEDIISKTNLGQFFRDAYALRLIFGSSAQNFRDSRPGQGRSQYTEQTYTTTSQAGRGDVGDEIGFLDNAHYPFAEISSNRWIAMQDARSGGLGYACQPGDILDRQLLLHFNPLLPASLAWVKDK